MNKTILVLFFFLLVSFSCRQQKDISEEYISEELIVKQLSEHVWEHTSYLKTQEWGKVPCNGIIVIDDNEGIIIDTPTNEESAIELLDWLESQKVEVKAIVPTHFHIDCLAGLNYYHSKNIPSYSSSLTAELANNSNFTKPQNTFKDSLILNVDDHSIIFRFEGSGHTKDNIVAYIPSDKVLFGGCLIKGKGWAKGNLVDADTIAWANSVMKTMVDYPEMEIVVPGHGGIGDITLLEYTIKMFSTDK